MPSVRKTAPHREELDALIRQHNLRLTDENGPLSLPVIGNGTTAGRLRTTGSTTFRINGQLYSKASTDDLWNLSALTNVGAGVYRGVALCISDAGVATIVAGTANADAEAAARAALALVPSTVAVLGVYIAGPSTDWDDAGGLAAQGEIRVGRPALAAAITSIPV